MSTNTRLEPQLRIASGHDVGRTFPIPLGVSVVGRGPEATVRLADAGVSRRHATVHRDRDRIILTDHGSVNGTWVNGQRVIGGRDLRQGDAIKIGGSTLVCEVATSAPHAWSAPGPPTASWPSPDGPTTWPSEPRARRRRVRLWRVLVVGAVASILVWAATTALTAFADKVLALPAWMLAPATAVVGGLVQTVVDLVSGSSKEPEVVARERPRGVPALVAVLTILIVFGAGGYGLTVGIRYAVGMVTGNEEQVGQERMASSPAPSDKSGQVTVTVTSIVNTAHFTRVEISVSNQEAQPATLALFHNCVLTAGGTTLQADPFKSGWVEDVAPGSTQRGHVIFPGRVPDSASTAQFSFLRVFVFGRFGDDNAVVIKSIRLRGP